MTIPFLWPYLLLTVLAVLEFPIHRRRLRPLGGRMQDAGSRKLLGMLLAAGMAAAFAVRPAPGKSWGFWRLPVGSIIFAAGEAFRLWSVRCLGDDFSVIVQTVPGQTVVERGPYRLIRHPSYTGAIAAFAGIGMTLGSGLSLSLILIGAALGYAYRIKVEETVLCRNIGDPYRTYMKRTKRLIPFVL